MHIITNIWHFTFSMTYYYAGGNRTIASNFAFRVYDNAI